jgi:tRNA(Arg) A34 adenosine deaminase TadA
MASTLSIPETISREAVAGMLGGEHWDGQVGDDGDVDMLSEPWGVALDLAWEGMVAGTTPVGCVVIDGDGAVVTRGRGRRYDRDAARGQLSYSHLAHAELNALAQLPPTQRYEGLTVLTTLEPCILCVGAAIMATVGKVEYAGADPYGGAAHLVLKNAHTTRLMPQIIGPDRGALGTFGALLHYAFYLERNPHGAVVDAYRQDLPHFVRDVDSTGVTEEVLRLKAEQRARSEVMALIL